MRTVLLTVLVAMTACASKSPDTTAAPERADGEHLTEFQKARLLGHYSTPDGKSGFILDRTVDPPLAKLDGAKVSHPLTRQGSVTGAYELVSDEGDIWLRIDEDSGGVLLFDGPQQQFGVEVVRDADADRL